MIIIITTIIIIITIAAGPVRQRGFLSEGPLEAPSAWSVWPIAAASLSLSLSLSNTISFRRLFISASKWESAILRRAGRETYPDVLHTSVREEKMVPGRASYRYPARFGILFP